MFSDLRPDEFAVVFVDSDELHRVLHPKVCESHDAVFTDAIDPNDAVLDFHFVGDFPQPGLVFAELLAMRLFVVT